MNDVLAILSGLAKDGCLSRLATSGTIQGTSLAFRAKEEGLIVAQDVKGICGWVGRDGICDFDQVLSKNLNALTDKEQDVCHRISDMNHLKNCSWDSERSSASVSTEILSELMLLSAIDHHHFCQEMSQHDYEAIQPAVKVIDASEVYKLTESFHLFRDTKLIVIRSSEDGSEVSLGDWLDWSDASEEQPRILFVCDAFRLDYGAKMPRTALMVSRDAECILEANSVTAGIHGCSSISISPDAIISNEACGADLMAAVLPHGAQADSETDIQGSLESDPFPFPIQFYVVPDQNLSEEEPIDWFAELPSDTKTTIPPHTTEKGETYTIATTTTIPPHTTEKGETHTIATTEKGKTHTISKEGEPDEKEDDSGGLSSTNLSIIVSISVSAALVGIILTACFFHSKYQGKVRRTKDQTRYLIQASSMHLERSMPSEVAREPSWHV